VDEALAWLCQAAADRAAAEQLVAVATEAGHCHAIAKWQQTVEKAVKAVVACLREAKVLHIDIGYDHGVHRFISVLIRLPHARHHREIQQHLHGLLDQETRTGIQALDALVPRRPPSGSPARRNTEYPFADGAGSWTYPAAEDVFSSDEMERFRSVARRILDRAGRIVSAIRRMPK